MASLSLRASVSSWRATLAPWLDALRAVRLSRARCDAPHETPRAWLHCQAPTSTTAWLKLQEAMELMELLTRVEPHTARTLLDEVTRMGSDEDADDADVPLQPRFQIRFEGDASMLSVVSQQGLQRLLTSSQHALSAKYTDVKTLLLTQWMAINGGRALDRDADGRVVVSLELNISSQNDSTTTRIFDQLHAIAVSAVRYSATVSSDGRPGRRCTRGVFTIDSFDVRLFSLSSSGIPSRLLLNQLNRVASTGMKLSHLFLFSLLFAPPSVLGRFLVDQLLPIDADRGLRSLEIIAWEFDEASVHVVCTAIARSTSLRQIRFEVNEESRISLQHEWWTWLAFALFSSFSDNEVHTVSLRAHSLTMSHVESIRNMLLHDNPLSLLYQWGSTAEQRDTSEVVMVTLRSSPVIYIGHHFNAVDNQDLLSRRRIQSSALGVKCQVIRDREHEDFVEFFLPGTGVCWVDRSQIVKMKPLVRRSTHAVRHLHVTHDQLRGVTAQPVVQLLQMVGGPLERLHIDHPRTLVDATFLSALLPACPSLVHLELSGIRLENFDWVVNAPSKCKLKKLWLSKTHTDDWPRLFGALSDTAHPLAKSLRHLRIDFHFNGRADDEAQEEQDTICKDVFVMLGKNRLLQRCELWTCYQTLIRSYKPRLLAHHDEPLDEGVLAMRVKLAFLSAMANAQPPGPPHKKSKRARRLPPILPLSSDVVQLVFAFAGEPKRRVCCME